MLVAARRHADFGKCSSTSRFNRMCRKFEELCKDDILFTMSGGKGKKVHKLYILPIFLEDLGASFLEATVTKSDLQTSISESNVFFTIHSIARIHQTFGTRSLKEFFITHRKAALTVYLFGQYQAGLLPDDRSVDFSLWDPIAEFRCNCGASVFTIETVISTASMAPIKVQLAKKDALSGSPNTWWIPDLFEKFSVELGSAVWNKSFSANF